MKIVNLNEHVEVIPLLAKWHFRQWGDLTGASSEDDYRNILSEHTSSQKVPMTLLALNCDVLLGSVNIVKSDLEIRPELTPWIAQLYVVPEQRSKGIGSTLASAAIARSADLGYDAIYLYTSGTLPSYYESIGWTTREIVHYKGKERIVMEIKMPVKQSIQRISYASR